MTWLLVSTRPLDDRTMPVPSAVALLYVRAEVMSTMPGSTLAASALASSGPVPLLVPPWLEPPWLGAFPLPLVGSGNGVPPPLPLPPKGLDCAPDPPSGEVADGALLEWLSATAAPAPAAAASTATAR